MVAQLGLEVQPKADRQGSEPQSCHGGRAAEREGMERILCHLSTHCFQLLRSPLFLPASRASQTFSATSHHTPVPPPGHPGHSALACHTAAPMSLYPHPQTGKNQAFALTPRGCPPLALSDFLFFPLFLNLARVGEKEAGTPGGGSSRLTAGWLAGSWSQGEKGGVLCLQTGERPPSALPPPAGAVHPDLDQWPHPPVP